jgi:hypothetical protein
MATFLQAVEPLILRGQRDVFGDVARAEFRPHADHQRRAVSAANRLHGT